MSEENRAVLPAGAVAAAAAFDAVAPFAELFGRGTAGELSSFDTRSVEGRQLLQKCEEAPDQSLRTAVNKSIRVRHVYAQRIELVNEQTAEAVPATRICVIATDGRVYACVSEGVRQSVWRLIRGHGLPPWKDGIPVTVTLKELGNKRQWLTLLEDFDTPAAGKGNR